MGIKVSVLCPASEFDEAALEILRQQVAGGLTRRFIVLRDDGSASWIDADDNEGGRPILDVLAELGPIDLLRLVLVALDGSSARNGRVDQINNLRQGVAGVRLAVGAVTSCLHGDQVDESLFFTYWNYNLIVAPEEGLGEAGTIFRPVTSDERLLAVGVAAVAFVAGLWIWLDDTPFDSLPHAGDAEVLRVRLARLTTRVVDTGDITSLAVQRALSPGVRLPPPPGCVRHSAPGQAVERVLDVLAPKQGPSPIGFGYRPPPAKERRPVQILGFFQLIRYFFIELWSELRPMPRRAVLRKLEEARQRVEGLVQGKTFGEDSDIVLRLRSPGQASLLFDQEQRRDLVAQLSSIDVAPVAPSEATWKLFVAALLGAADGAAMPDGIVAAQPEDDGERAVIGAELLAPLPDHVPIRVTAAELVALGFSADAPAGIRRTDVRALTALTQVPSARPDGSEPAQEADDALGTPSEPSSSDDGEQVPTEASSEASAPTATSAASSVAEIVRRDSKSLTWRLGYRLLGAQDQALSDLAESQAALDRIEEEINEAIAGCAENRKRFLRRSLLIILLVVLLAVATIVGYVIVSSLIAGILGAAFLLSLVGGAFAMARLARTRIQWKHRLEDLAGAPERLMQRRQHAASEFRRLSSLYEQFIDWSEIVGCALHRPWGTIPVTDVRPWTTQTGVLSFSCGEPVISTVELTAVTLGVTQRVATKGWLRKAYEHRRATWIADYHRVTGRLAGHDMDPEADPSTASRSRVELPSLDDGAPLRIDLPRPQFCTDFAKEYGADRYRADQIRELRDGIIPRDPSRLIESVISDVPGLTGRTAEEFIRPPTTSPPASFSDETFLAASVRVSDSAGVKSWVGISPSIAVPAPPEQMVTVLEPKGRFVLASVRLDMTEPLTLEQCPLVRPTRRITSPGGEPPIDSESSPDDTRWG